MKSKVDLIFARAAMIYHGTKCQNHNDLFITSFIPWSWFCGQGEPRGVGSLQRFQSIETSEGNGDSASFLGELTAEEFARSLAGIIRLFLVFVLSNCRLATFHKEAHDHRYRLFLKDDFQSVLRSLRT